MKIEELLKSLRSSIRQLQIDYNPSANGLTYFTGGCVLVMKRRSVLSNQTVKKRKKEKAFFTMLSAFRRVITGFFMGSFILIIAGGISISLLYLYHYLQTTPYLRLEHVEVRGVDDETSKGLIEICRFDSYSNLLFLNIEEMEKRMEAHPWIRSVKLEKKLPRTLVVQAEKHVPTALVLMDGVYYMNQYCEVFKTVDASDDLNFPVITGVSRNEPDATQKLNRAVEAIKILKNCKGPWSFKELSEINVAHEEISLYFNHLPVAIHVMSRELSDKMGGLIKITKLLKDTGRIDHVSGINLNISDGAMVSFKKG